MADAAARIGFLVPMRSEMRPLARLVALAPREPGGERRYGAVGDVEVVTALTGIGTRLARTAAARMLDAEALDHVVVCGIAGGIRPHAEVGDLVVPSVVVDADGVEHEASPLSDAMLEGRLRTSDDFEVDTETIERLAREGVIAVDMETAAIAAVCEARGVPWTAFRAISDMAGETPAAVLTMTKPDGSPDLGASLRYFARHPGSAPRFARLARDATRAAETAAAAAIAAVRSYVR